MLRLAIDQNFHDAIVVGLLRRCPELDIVRLRDEGLMAAEDPVVLAWAAGNQRVLLTHDRQTIPGHAYDRVRHGMPMSGVFVVDTVLPIGEAIEEILTLVLCSVHDEEWKDRVLFVPIS